MPITTDHVTFRLRKRTQRLLLGERLLLRLGDQSLQIKPYRGPNALAFDLLCGGTTRQDLARKMSDAHGDSGAAGGLQMFDRLQERGLLEELGPSHGIGPLDEARFDRLLNYFSPSETPASSRFDYLGLLRAAKVTVIGTGGLGSWIIYNLLCCGVGTLKLIDADQVEYSNLNRSILYGEANVKQPKVEAARDAILRFAPRTQVEVRNAAVTGDQNLRPEVAGQDLVIATADEPPWEVRQWVADACVAAGVPLLHPSGFHVGPLYTPGGGSCPMCEWAYLVDQQPRQAEILTAQRTVPPCDPGAVSHVGTITAGVVAAEALRFLTGFEAPATVSGIWTMNDRLESGIRPLPAHPQCGVCGTRTAAYRIPAAERLP